MLSELEFKGKNSTMLSNDLEKLENISTENGKLLKLMDAETKKQISTLSFDYPFTNPGQFLPNNRKITEKQLMSFKNRFLRKTKFWIDYGRFFANLLVENQAWKSVGDLTDEKFWYIPHGCVCNVNKKKSELCLTMFES